ncbi:MAG: sigma-70 family RNA polymerase sigma factor [Firmicutes bacterium]|nr:sigma-70 family RNA polymerase sigma factor [Bacillota bacterium]
MEEQEIHQRLLREDTSALELVMDRYGSCVYKLAATILRDGNKGMIEECCSDVFVAVWEKKHQFNPQRGNFRTWVLILARYQALDYRRHLLRQRAVEDLYQDDSVTDAADPGGTPETYLMQKELRVQLIAALETLPVSMKDVLYRRYFLEESIEDMAEELGLSRGAVDNRLWRARHALKLYLHEQEGKVVSLHG